MIGVHVSGESSQVEADVVKLMTMWVITMLLGLGAKRRLNGAVADDGVWLRGHDFPS